MNTDTFLFISASDVVISKVMAGYISFVNYFKIVSLTFFYFACFCSSDGGPISPHLYTLPNNEIP